MSKLREKIEQAVDVAMNMGVGHGQEQVTVDQYGNARDRATDRILALIAEAMLSDGAKNASAHEMQELSAQGVIHNHTLAFYGMKAALTAAGITGAGQEGTSNE